MGNCLGNCWSGESLEKQTQAVYTPLSYKPYALSKISEVSQETEGDSLEPPPLSI